MHASYAAAAAAVLAWTRAAAAFTTPCVYQEYKCGSELLASDGYNLTEFTTAVNATSTIPPLQDDQLLDVLYRCVDVDGGLAGNSYCFSGCIGMASTSNDQCAM